MDNGKKVPRVLTIAGSDSGGGAGIQADLKTFLVHQTYGMSVITALTAQNTLGVQEIHNIPCDFVNSQINSVVADIGVDCVKTGMLSNADIVECVASNIKKYGIKNVVVDPVMVSTSGHRLLDEAAVDNMKHLLFPLATIVTPNIPEAICLTDMKEINTIEDMKQTAKKIGSLGCQYVLLKGGHLEDAMAVDILYHVQEDVFHELSGPRITSRNTHGTGCTLAASIAAEIGKGKDVVTAVKNAKEYVSNTLKASANLIIGQGHGPLMHHYCLENKPHFP